MPRKTWSQKDERKYKAIVKSCKLSSGAKKKGAAKECQRIAAATVERDRGGLRGGVPPIPGLFAPPLRGNRPLPRVGRGLAPQAQHDADRSEYEQRLAEWNRRTMRSPNADPALLQAQAAEDDHLLELWDSMDEPDHPGDRMRGLRGLRGGGGCLPLDRAEADAVELALDREAESLVEGSASEQAEARTIGAVQDRLWAMIQARGFGGMRGLGDPRTAARVRPAYLNVVADKGNLWAENKIVGAEDSPEEPWWLDDEYDPEGELLESHFPEVNERLDRLERLTQDEAAGLRREGATRYTDAVNAAMERWRTTGAMPTTEPVREPRGMWDAVIYEGTRGLRGTPAEHARRAREYLSDAALTPPISPTSRAIGLDYTARAYENAKWAGDGDLTARSGAALKRAFDAASGTRGLRGWDDAEDRIFARERDRSRAGLDDPDEPELDPDEPPPRWGASPRPSARAWPRALPAGATLLVDDEHESSLEDFLEANREGLDPSEAHRVARLSPGQTHQGGGGAAADWKVKRLRGGRR